MCRICTEILCINEVWHINASLILKKKITLNILLRVNQVFSE